MANAKKSLPKGRLGQSDNSEERPRDKEDNPSHKEDFNALLRAAVRRKDDRRD